MSTDLTIILKDRPGTMADLGEALGKAGVNIDGGCGFLCEGVGVAHILVEDAAEARRAAEAAGFEVRADRPVLVFEAKDEPGELGNIARRIADAGVNVELLYVASGDRLVLGADDLDKARAAIG
ncbi:MAG: amino acid-binding protein [Candidatus Thorarchaeota archaeon]